MKQWSYICVYKASYPVVFRLSPGNSHDALEGSKLIESIYPKDNTSFLMNGAYENGKTISLAKAHDFHAVVSPKKNRKSLVNTN